MVVTRRLNDVITRFTLHGSREPFACSDCENARLRGNDKLHFQCLLALCLYRDTAVFLVYSIYIPLTIIHLARLLFIFLELSCILI